MKKKLVVTFVIVAVVFVGVNLFFHPVARAQEEEPVTPTRTPTATLTDSAITETAQPTPTSTASLETSEEDATVTDTETATATAETVTPTSTETSQLTDTLTPIEEPTNTSTPTMDSTMTATDPPTPTPTPTQEQLINPESPKVSSSNDLSVQSMQSFTAQNYTFGAYDWEQVNTSGFGEVGNDTIQALSTFGCSIYAGTSNDAGAQLWRSTDGESWTSITTDGFGDVKNLAVDHLYEFDGSFYAGTQNADNPSQSNGGEVWRSDSGDAGTWNQVVWGGFGDSVNGGIYRFIAFNNQLYASTFSWDTSTQGGEIWRSSSGDSESWSQVVSDGFSDSNNAAVLSFAVFNGYIYAGTQNIVSGGEVWRSDTGNDASWEQVNTDGFGTIYNKSIPALAAFDGYLYAVTRNDNGVQVWRCQTCDQASDWTNVSGNFDDCDQVSGLEVYKQSLYLVAGSNTNGLEVWRTSNGTTWDQIADGGFGDSSNQYTFRDNAFTVFDHGLFVGTYNGVDGGEIWALAPTFADVFFDYWAYDFIESLHQSGITSGCGDGNYCPGGLVTRAQMAVFLERGIHGSDYTPPSASGIFDDVPTSYWAASWIEQLYNDGITSGCGGGDYCPNSPVTRAQMAIFLLRSKHGSSYTPPSASGIFDDVPTSYWAASWIEQLYDEGITSGCGDGDFCPNASVTRAQMAVFLTKTFNLPIP